MPLENDNNYREGGEMLHFRAKSSGNTVLTAMLLVAPLGCTNVANDPGAEHEMVDLVANSVAAGCTPNQPTSVGGGVWAYPDLASVNAAIGVGLMANGVPVDATGQPCSGSSDTCIGNSNYAFMVAVNPTLGPEGAPADTPGLTRSWSRCVAASVTDVYYEGYPRNQTGHTDESRYAETMSNRLGASAGAAIRYDMRFPVTYEADPAVGNTGNINGVAYCHGIGTPVTRINAWTTTSADGCGVHAYQSGGSDTAASGYYKIGPMAAGQCGMDHQTVSLVLHVNCDGRDMSQAKHVDVVRGRTIGAVNYHFP